MKVRELIKTLENLENTENAEVKVCMYNGNFTEVTSVEWDEKDNCYVIYCIGEEENECYC